jgi:hypothetical protein
MTAAQPMSELFFETKRGRELLAVVRSLDTRDMRTGLRVMKFVPVSDGAQWPCHSCGDRPAAWRSSAWNWGDEVLDFYGLDRIVFYGVPGPLVPLMCDPCIGELVEVAEVMGAGAALGV